MEESSQRKLGAILSYVSIIASTLVQLLYTPFLIRMLGQSEYGLYSLTSSVIGYLTLFDLGFGNAIIVHTAKYNASNQQEKAKKMQGMFKIVFYILGLIVALFGLILYFNVNSFFGNSMTSTELEKSKIMMLILTFNLVITFCFNIYSAIINAHERFIFQKLISILNTILKPLIMIPLLFLGYKSIAMCIGITIVNIIVVLSNFFYCTKRLKIDVKYKGFDNVVFKEILSYSIFIFINIVVDKVNWSLDQFILGAVCGTVAVSIYSVASQLNTLFVNLSSAISGVLLPKVSKMVAKKATPDELTSEMIKVGRIQWLIIFLMASGLVFFGKKFIILWAGESYIDSYYVALLLILPVCIPLIQNLGLSICQALNKHHFRSYATLIMAVINAVISYFFAKSYGTIGTALGTALALIICNIIIMNIYYQRAIKLNMFRFWKEILKMSIPFVIPVIIIILFMNFININGVLGIIIYAVSYIIIYCITVYTLSMNNYEKDVVNKIFIKLHIKKV